MKLYKGRSLQSYQKSVDNAQEALWWKQEHIPDGEPYLKQHKQLCEDLARKLEYAQNNLKAAKLAFAEGKSE